MYFMVGFFAAVVEGLGLAGYMAYYNISNPTLPPLPPRCRR